MPYSHRKRMRADPNYSPMPEWAYGLENTCLQEEVREAIDARSWALDRGADKHPSGAKLLRVGDKILHEIEHRIVRGDKACRKAAQATRKFNTAGEHARSTAA
jgi:hypothetical protein